MTIHGRDGATYALVVFTDGGYGVTRNGERDPAQYWPDGRMQECVDHVLRAAGMSLNGDGEADGEADAGTLGDPTSPASRDGKENE